jgi:hypothetical protein
MKFVYLPSEMSLSLISQAKMVGFSRLYCSILETTVGVATLGLLPPMRPGGLSAPETPAGHTPTISKLENAVNKQQNIIFIYDGRAHIYIHTEAALLARRGRERKMNRDGAINR